MTDPLTPLLLGYEATLDREGWDRPATVFWVMNDAAAGPEPSLFELPLNTTLLMTSPGWYVELFERLAALGAPPHPEVIVGVGFSDEGWMVWAAGKDTAGIERNFTDALGRRIHTREDRQEYRAVYIVDRQGRQHVIQRVRGAEPRILDGPDREHGGGPWGGDIIRHLRAYATVVMGPLG